MCIRETAPLLLKPWIPLTFGNLDGRSLITPGQRPWLSEECVFSVWSHGVVTWSESCHNAETDGASGQAGFTGLCLINTDCVHLSPGFSSALAHVSSPLSAALFFCFSHTSFYSTPRSHPICFTIYLSHRAAAPLTFPRS